MNVRSNTPRDSAHPRAEATRAHEQREAREHERAELRTEVIR
jgi:hypothetical protein